MPDGGVSLLLFVVGESTHSLLGMSNKDACSISLVFVSHDNGGPVPNPILITNMPSHHQAVRVPGPVVIFLYFYYRIVCAYCGLGWARATPCDLTNLGKDNEKEELHL